MFKYAKNLLLAATLITSLNAASQLPSKEVKQMENLDLFKRAGIVIKKAYDTESIYLLNIEVRGKTDTIYLTKDKKYLIAGDVINTNTGLKLSVPADLSNTIGKEAFTYGTGKDEYVLFTDPECPYCKKFESHFPKIKDKVKIRVFYYPLDFHVNAKDLSLYAMSKTSPDEKARVMLNVTKDSEEFKNRKFKKGELSKLEKHLDVQMKLAQELGVRGTPSLYDKNGNKVIWTKMLQDYGVNLR